MKNFVVSRLMVGSVLVALLPGCATYYNHFGRFSGENASGEVREFLVHWQTADYPDWALLSDRSTPITLETQCSERGLKFFDQTQADEGLACSSDKHSILWCGESGKDLAMDGRPAGRQQLCGWIAGNNGESLTIPQIGATLQLSLQCWPANPTVGSGEDKKNFDYLKASSVPYVVAVKKVEQGSWDDRPLKLDDKICKVEEE